MLHDVVSGALRACSQRPCFRIYGKATYESDWRVIDVFATHRRDALSRWPLWRGCCITWTDQVIAVGWDFAALVLQEQSASPASRSRPVEVVGGRLNDERRRIASGGSSRPSAGEILAHECGHTAQARRLGVLYWPIGAAFTLLREGSRWWNQFENQASEIGQFGGFVSDSVWTERFGDRRSIT